MKTKTKVCTKCKKEKSVKEFGLRWVKESTLLKAYCKDCSVRVASNWNKKNREKYNKYQNDYYHKVRKQNVKKST